MLVNGLAPTVPQLAQELIDAIIDHVAADSITDDLWPAANMLQISLVNRSFRPRSLRYMFSSVGIRGETHQVRRTRAQQLFDIIKENPQIAHYIRGIWLESVDFEPQTQPLLEDKRIILDVVEKISPLRNLTLSASYIEHPVGPLLLRNLIIPFIAPSITCLNLVEIENIPMEVITSCANLTSLGLTMVQLIENGHSDISRTVTALQLKHLSYRRSSIAMRQLLRQRSYLDLSQLKSFSVFTDDPHYALYSNQVLAIILSSCDSLEELYLSDPIGGSQPWTYLDLQRLDRLCSVHVFVPFYSQSIMNEKSMRFILGPLSTVRPRSLENLSIEARVSFGSDMLKNTQGLEILISADWTNLCSHIARIMTGMGSTFEFKLTCRISLSVHGAPAETEVRNQLQKQCQSVMDKLRRDSFRALKEDHNIDCISPSQAQIFIDRL